MEILLSSKEKLATKKGAVFLQLLFICQVLISNLDSVLIQD